MYCNNCGAKLEDNTHHCPKCGAVVTGTRASAPAGLSVSQDPPDEASSVLFWSILGIVCAIPVCLLGVAFSCVGLYRANRFLSTHSEYSRKVSLGRTFSICGVAVSLFMCILVAVLIYFGIKLMFSNVEYI